MSAAALLAKTPKPTDQDINSAMNGNLCRCGTYIRIRQAIHKAAEIATTSKIEEAVGSCRWAKAALRNKGGNETWLSIDVHSYA